MLLRTGLGCSCENVRVEERVLQVEGDKKTPVHGEALERVG